MTTIAVVFLSVLAGLFLSLILAAACALIYQGYKLRSLVADLKSSMHSDATLVSSALSTLSADVARTFRDNQSEMSGMLVKLSSMISGHQTEIRTLITQINGEGLQLASRQIVLGAQRIEKAALAFAELSQVFIADRKVNPNELGEEEYAAPEPGEKFIFRSKSAALDAAALQAEAQEGTQGEGSGE